MPIPPHPFYQADLAEPLDLADPISLPYLCHKVTVYFDYLIII